MMKKINIFLGNYGSGKTEISLNMAKKLKQSGHDVTLFDLDIVNPYFRSSEHKQMLEDLGITLVAPIFANTAVDLPTLSPQVNQITTTNHHVVVDCGGDPAGATALGYLSKSLNDAKEKIDIYFVMNTSRPLQSDANLVIEMINSIEHVSNLRVNKLIINSNLSYESDLNVLNEGIKIGKQVAELKNLEIAYISGTKEILKQYKEQSTSQEFDLFPIEIFTRPEWLETK